MDWLFILKEVLGWAIPLICAAVLAVAIKPIKEAQKARTIGQEVLDQQEWDEKAEKLTAKVTERLNALENRHTSDQVSLQQDINTLKQHDLIIDNKLEEIIKILNVNEKARIERFEQMDAKNTAAFIQIYQRDLIVDGKTYISNKRITPQQLANFEKRYKQYKEWGGNGDVEPWIKKIRELPVHYPTIMKLDE